MIQGGGGGGHPPPENKGGGGKLQYRLALLFLAVFMFLV